MDKLIDKLNRIDCTHADAKEAAARIRLLEAEVEALRQAQSEVCGKLWKFVGTDIDADGRDCADLAIERATTAEAQLAAERERAEKAEEKSRNLQMICAWLSTEVTEGWLVRGLGVDRISIRTIRDHAIGEVIGNPDYVCPMSDWEDRALAAEAERDAMREALRKIVNFPCDGDGPRAWVMDMMSIARAAIAGEETAKADDPQKGA